MEPVVALLSSCEQNAKWLSKHHEELKKKFNNQWFAVQAHQIGHPFLSSSCWTV